MLCWASHARMTRPVGGLHQGILKVPDVEKRIRADRIVDTGLTLEEQMVFSAMGMLRVHIELLAFTANCRVSGSCHLLPTAATVDMAFVTVVIIMSFNLLTE